MAVQPKTIQQTIRDNLYLFDEAEDTRTWAILSNAADRIDELEQQLVIERSRAMSARQSRRRLVELIYCIDESLPKGSFYFKGLVGRIGLLRDQLEFMATQERLNREQPEHESTK